MKIIFCLLMFTLSSQIQAQDERFFRDFLRKKPGLAEREALQKIDKTIYSWKVSSPEFYYDFNFDGIKEYFQIQKKDAIDFLSFYRSDGEILFEAKFIPKGGGSRIYKMDVSRINDKSTLLILYYYEGKNSYINLKGQARIYLLTIVNNNLKTMTITKGPLVWDERKMSRDHYHQRHYKVDAIDLDADGVKEVLVKYHKASRVMKYHGNGVWQSF